MNHNIKLSTYKKQQKIKHTEIILYYDWVFVVSSFTFLWHLKRMVKCDNPL